LEHVAGEEAELSKYIARFRVVKAGTVQQVVTSTPFELPPSDNVMLAFAHDVLKETNPCAVAAYDYDKSSITALAIAQACVNNAVGFEKALGYHVWARILHDENKPDEALQKIDKAIRLNQRSAVLYVTRSAIWSQKASREPQKDQVIGEQSNAIEDARRAIKYDPNSSMAYNNLGSLLLKSGQSPEAESALRRAIALNGNNKLAKANLRRLPANKAGGDSNSCK
jgi:tetratricopeptide (TPR) repeat protein